MAVARVSRIIASSTKGFQDAVETAVKRATKTLRGVTGGEVSAHKVKIENGKIRRVEAVFHRAPYGINSGWSTYEQGMSDEPQIVR